MLTPSAPREYVTRDYLEYQKKYAQNMRESDKVLLRLIAGAAEQPRPEADGPLRLLDIGCSNGNLLVHLRKLLPDAELHGGDLYPEILEHCRANPELAGAHFEVMDVRDLPAEPRYDVVVSNAVIHRFRDPEFLLTVRSLGRVLRPGGWLFAFEFYHPYEQQVELVERTALHPEGLTLVYRSFSQVARLLREHGFAEVRFLPFDIPIDLPKPADPGDTRTFTVRTEAGERLNFRGCLCTPWCHLVARKG